MVMFGFIYALLLAVWIYLLNDKIRRGPEPPPAPPPHPDAGLIEAAAARIDGRLSLTGDGVAGRSRP